MMEGWNGGWKDMFNMEHLACCIAEGTNDHPSAKMNIYCITTFTTPLLTAQTEQPNIYTQNYHNTTKTFNTRAKEGKKVKLLSEQEHLKRLKKRTDTKIQIVWVLRHKKTSTNLNHVTSRNTVLEDQ